MRGAFFWILMVSLAAGCTKGSGDVIGHHPDMGSEGGTGDLGAPDLGGTACTMDSMCNDAMDCTIDHCGVGNVCTHNDTCTGGLHCTATGCAMMMVGSCSSNPECNDHDACNGVETCIIGTHMCVPGRAVDCNDGDPCTTDACDSATGMCVRTVTCDGGIGPPDAGPPPPFDPATDYPGRFFMGPTANSGCGCATYNVSDLTFSVAGGTLNVATDAASVGTLTQTPAPTGASFDVSRTTGCGTYQITGTFLDRNHFMGTWSANAGACGPMSMSIDGYRH